MKRRRDPQSGRSVYGEFVVTAAQAKEEQEVSIAEAPEVYSMAAYVGRFGWVQVELSKVDKQELRELVIEAWRRTAPKKLVKEYEAVILAGTKQPAADRP